MKVLIVDDSIVTRRAISIALEQLPNVYIRMAKDGREALEKVLSWKPDVVTLDMTMPKMDGLTCLSHIMAQAPCPVVMISSLVSKESSLALEALSIGAVEVLQKPIGLAAGNIALIKDELCEVVVKAAQASVRDRRQRGGRDEKKAQIHRKVGLCVEKASSLFFGWRTLPGGYRWSLNWRTGSFRNHYSSSPGIVGSPSDRCSASSTALHEGSCRAT